jgi:hypothetical protein
MGSSMTQFKMQDDTPTLLRLPQVNFVNDNAGKPVARSSVIRIQIASAHTAGRRIRTTWRCARCAPNAGWTVIAVKADWKQIFKN